MELTKENQFHFSVVNDELQKAIDEVDKIIIKEIGNKNKS
jgi:guanylate kinase